MRLIGTLQGEKEAYKFHSFLIQEEIECSYNPTSSGENLYEFWIAHEDQIDTAIHWLEEFRKNPNDPRFETKAHPIDTEGVAKDFDEKEPIQMKAIRMRNRMRPKMALTRIVVLLCALLYIWNGYQMADIAKTDKKPEEYTLTPLMIDLSYDMPTAENRKELSRDLFAEDRIGRPAVWDGIYGVVLGWPASKSELAAPMFEQIKHGQIWRLFTPVLLHGSFLHILFNMLWLWMLGRQVEERTKKWQYIALTLIIGVVSNTLQYLMSGPLFIGYSGIVCGLAGFIWMRQCHAPWEGYPLQKGTLVFLGVFIVAMMGLQLVSFFLIRFQIAEFSMNIANTAHISGALTGIVLGKIPVFSKGGMSVRDLTILGCSSQQPTRLRNHGAYLLRWNQEGLLFDPGEGTQRQFIFADIAPPTVTRIFVSHFHGDHCLGLGSMLMRLNLDRVNHPIHCYYPASGKVYFDRLRYGTLYHDHIQVIEHPVSEEGIVHQDDTFTIEAKFLNHGVDNLGWRIQEANSIKFDKEKLTACGVKGTLVRELQEKKQVIVDGEMIKIEDVSWVRKGDIFACVIDTKHCQNAIDLAKGAKLLLCESTYLEEHRALAEDHNHMTAKQAAFIAKEAGVQKLILTHFSARYRDLLPFAEEASEIFPNVDTADDFKRFEFLLSDMT